MSEPTIDTTGWLKVSSSNRTVFQPPHIVHAMYEYAAEHGISVGDVLERWFQEHPENDLDFVRELTDRARRALKQRLS